MSTQAHTLGPWLFSASGAVMQGYSQPFAIAEAGKPNLVAGCFGDVRGGHETAEANARLIAAAPDLYLVAQFDECLDEMKRCGSAAEFLQDHGWDMQGPWTAEEWVREKRRAAIAKAERT
jgi:hypothetical protein